MFYHEDDHNQIQILPRENYKSILQEIADIDEHARKHWDGVGFTDVYIREDEEAPIALRKITVGELDELLLKLGVARHSAVTTGIKPGEFKCKNTIGYGEQYHGIFYNYTDGIVTNIFIANFVEVEDDLLLDVLHQIGIKWDLLLVDWMSGDLVDLKDVEQIKYYLD